MVFKLNQHKVVIGGLILIQFGDDWSKIAAMTFFNKFWNKNPFSGPNGQILEKMLKNA